PQESYRFGDRKLTGAGESLPQGLAFHVWHDVVEKAVGIAGVEQAEDVRMLEPCGDFDFAGEALGTHRGGQVGPQHLHRDVAMMAEILGELDGRHAALAEFFLQAVAVGECGGKARVDGQWFGSRESRVESLESEVGRPRLSTLDSRL